MHHRVNDEWRSDFGWSSSKSCQWASCRRQFYYRNIKRFDPDEEGRRAGRLARLTSMRALAGTAVHLALTDHLLRAAAGGRTSPSATLRFAERRFEERLAGPTPVLVEEVNGLPAGREEKDAALDSIRTCVGNFHRAFWPRLAEERYISCDQGTPVRTRIAGADVYLGIDCLTQDGAGLTIRDWKTGDERTSHALQVAVYAVHVGQAHGLPASEIRAEIDYLAQPRAVAVPITAPLADAVKARIARESREMLACTCVDDLPPHPGEGCIRCNFATLCPEGQARL